MKAVLFIFIIFLTCPALVFAQEEGDAYGAFSQTNDSLYDALEQAYQNNPTARAARAELLAVKEQLPQAQANLKPSLSADGDVTYTNTETEGNSPVTSDGGNLSKSASLNLSQPLFRGGRTIAEINQAKNIIVAQELSVSHVEQTVLYDAVTAYMDLFQNKAVLKLNETNRDLVAYEKERAENRFRVGELTRTDVSQSEARLAEAEAAVITAQGDVRRSRAVYTQVYGTQPPEDLAYPQTLLDVPETLEEALNISSSNNREVLIAQYIKKAANDNITGRYGVFLPEIFAIGSLSKSYDPSDFVEEQDQAIIGVSASIPLYQGGVNKSLLREAQKTANFRAIEILEAQERIKQETISNWEILQTAQAEIKAREAQIKASRIAQEGVNYELEFGERTTLDALDANQELLNAQVQLILAKRDEVVARFALARTLGLLVPQKLGFSSIKL